MSEIKYPEMKTALSIYIETNHSFIMEKLYSEFRTQCVKDYELKDLEMDRMIATVKIIFKFGQHNEDMATFYQKLQTNLEAFINEKYRTVDEIQDMFINTDLLLEAIKYCVDHGFDPIKEEKPQKQQEIEEQIKEQIEVKKKKLEPAVIKKSEDQPQKPKKVFYIPKPKTPEEKIFLEKHEMPDRKKPARYLNHMAKKKPQETKIVQPEINVQPIDLSFLEKNRKTIDARLNKIYKHYCSQQQNLGNNATFDRILSECTHMNIGNFMLFCKVTSLFKHESISKLSIQAKFKQVSEGKKQIDFEEFKKILRQLDQKYLEAKKKSASSPTIEQIPTYEARLMLKNAEFLKMKKDVDFPFLTREKQGRQLKKYEYNTLDPSLASSRYKETHSQNHKREPTIHSGKFSKNLKEHLQTKQEVNNILNKSKNKKKELGENKKIIRLDNLAQHNWPGMQWAIADDQDDDAMFDSVLIKQKRNVAQQVRKRVADVEKMEKNRSKQNKYY